jgi:hypothetical protein
MKIIRKIALVASLVVCAANHAAAQVYLPPGVGLPPRSVIGNALPVAGDAVALSFAQLTAGLNIPALKTCASHQWFNTLAAGGVLGCSQPAVSDIAGFGAGVATFLGTPNSANLRAMLPDETGSGAAVFATGPSLVNANLGTPSAAILTNATGLPLSTGITGFGTGVATALGVNVGTGGAFYVVGGALGTPSSGVATNLTGLPISTGLTGAGTGVLAALGANVGSAGAPVLFNGALGTPSSGTLTNVSGLPISALTGFGAGMATWLATPSSANLKSAVTDETGTGGALVFALAPAITTPDIIGTTAVGNANAGSVGEFVQSIVASGSAVALTNATAANMTSIPLTAGDWDVWAHFMYTPAATTNITQLIGGINTTSATVSLLGDRIGITSYGSGGVVPTVFSGSPSVHMRINVSSPTTIYAVVQCSFTVSTLGAWGSLQARRRR